MQPSERARVEPRTRALVRARMRDSLGQREICLIDISTRGVLATTARPPRKGDIVALTIGANTLTGKVVWASERRFGVALRERVSVVAMVEGGRASVELARSVGPRRRPPGMLAAMLGDSQMLGRAGQFFTFAFLAAVVGWLILGLTEEALAPVQAAVAEMN